MISELLPHVPGIADSWGGLDEAEPSFGEAASLEGAGGVRLAEFGAGRSCARRALAKIGQAPGAIPRALDGSPVWPDGLAGSITHTRGYAAAAVEFLHHIRSIGIDAEPNEPALPSVFQRITDDEERRQIARYASLDNVHWGRLLFSAKEAVFKSWFPLTRRALRFTDVTVQLRPDDGTFSARILLPDIPAGFPAEMSGRWHCSEILLTAVTIPHEHGEA